MVIDVIVLAVLLISALISFIRGFIRETLTILGVVGGLAAAYFGGPMLSPLMKGWLGVVDGEKPKMLLGILPYPILADILSYGLIFIVIIIVLSIVSHILAESVRAIGLGMVDRTIGIIFGLVRGLLLVSVLYLPFHLSLDEKTKAEWFEGSRTQPFLEAIAGQIATYLPDDTVKQIKDSAQKVTNENGEPENTSNDVTDKLNNLQMLKDTVAPDQQNAPPQPENNNTPGYSDEFRQKMDQMFKTDGQPPAPAPEQQQQPQGGQP